MAPASIKPILSLIRKILIKLTKNISYIQNYQLKIINQMGSTVYETKVRDPLYEINLSSWTGPGLYFLQIIDYRKNIIDIRKIILR
ncbi:MAG: T9SS type A sorting domain-containing protein [Bacteroidales bacterium]